MSTDDKITLVSGTPEDFEYDVPSEDVEFSLAVVQTMPTLADSLEALGYGGGGGNSDDLVKIDVPVITAQTLRDIRSFCDSEAYGNFLNAYSSARAHALENGEDVQLIKVEGFDGFESMVTAGAEHLDSVYKISEDPCNEAVIEMLLAADYLDSKFIKRAISKLMVPHIVGKSVEEIEKAFKVNLSDVTEEEKAWGRKHLREQRGIDIPEPEQGSTVA